MKTPQVVVFDLGKVLLDFDYRIAANALAARSDVSMSQINQFINQSPLLNRYEKGEITRREFFEHVRDMSDYRGSLGSFSALFSDVFTPIQPMIRLQERLTAAGIPTYIFSNTNDLAITHIQANYPFYNNFDGYVLSYEHGFMKPETELYVRIEQLSGRTGHEIVYIDDREENVVAGSERGWVGILHRSPEESMVAVKRLGLDA